MYVLYRPEILPTVSEVNETVLPAITMIPNSEKCSESDGMPTELEPICASTGHCAALHNRRRFSRQRGSISLDESILVTSRLDTPTIHIIPDTSQLALPSELRAKSPIFYEEDFRTSTEKLNYGMSRPNHPQFFYTNEMNRVSPLNESRNSLPRFSLASVSRAFTPRRSWNGSKSTLIQMQRKPSRLEGVPAYLTRKYNLTMLGDRLKEQVIGHMAEINQEMYYRFFCNF